ncbi:MAG: GNAT family N-acetyltransferase [Caulobacter sp.]|nr:GNAT family N-acetyltransferase [Caulobacter sp.]
MLETERLVLRAWREEDLEPFAALNADPEVMRHFPSTLSRTESDALAARYQSHIDEHGFGRWAVERREDGVLLGHSGPMQMTPPHPLAPGAEMGWRLARAAWGQGYATEASRAAMAYCFEQIGLEQIFAFTSATNLPSQAVMERLGMTRRPDLDFDHLMFPEGHDLRRAVVWSS